MFGSKLLLFIIPVALLVASQPCDARTSNWQSHMDAGSASRKKRQFAESEEQLQAAVKQAERFRPADVRLAESLQSLGDTFNWEGKYPEAQAAYSRALAVEDSLLHPDNVLRLDTLSELARVRSLRKSTESIEPLVNQIMALEEPELHANSVEASERIKKTALLLSNLAVHMGKDNPALAEVMLNDSISLAPTSSGAYYDRACVRYTLGKIEAADADHKKAHQLGFFAVHCLWCRSRKVVAPSKNPGTLPAVETNF